MNAPTLGIYTIGHSNQEMKKFLRLLDRYRIDVLADVRSAPYSRWVPHFGKESLEQAVAATGREYIYLGRELGGRPDPASNPNLYDDEGHVRYDRVADLESFKSAIQTLVDRASSQRVAIMCSEDDPESCHRRLLIGRVLTGSYSTELHHIRRDGSETVETRVRLPGEGDPVQTSLFEDEGDRGQQTQWRSTRSALAGSQRENSSKS